MAGSGDKGRTASSTKAEGNGVGPPPGTGARALSGWGNVSSGLDRLIAGLEKSEVLQERLRAIEEAIAARARGATP